MTSTPPVGELVVTTTSGHPRLPPGPPTGYGAGVARSRATSGTRRDAGDHRVEPDVEPVTESTVLLVGATVGRAGQRGSVDEVDHEPCDGFDEVLGDTAVAAPR